MIGDDKGARHGAPANNQQHDTATVADRSGGNQVDRPGTPPVLGAFESVRPSGSGWLARCPAHDDRRPSLSIGVGRGGGVVIHCHAGCRPADVVHRAGLTWRDLLDARELLALPVPPPVFDPVDGELRLGRCQANLHLSRYGKSRLQDLRRWDSYALHELGLGLDREGRIVIPWRDAAGGLTGIGHYFVDYTLRGHRPKLVAEPGSRRQLFPRPERLDPNLGWLLVEGEPDAATAHAFRFQATAVPGVAAWRSEWRDRFVGQHIAVVFDCDKVGRTAAERVAFDLAGFAASVRVVDLDTSSADGFDLSDYLLKDGAAALRYLIRRTALRHA